MRGLSRCRRAAVRLTALALIGLSGCRASVPTGNVSGKVLLANGRPLPGGTILFFPQEGGRGNPVSGTINPEGEYEVTGVPVGQARIVITNANLRPEADSVPVVIGGKVVMPDRPTGKVLGGPPKDALKDMPKPAERPRPAGTYVPIDPRYGAADRSGLTCDVQPGSQVHNIEGIIALDSKK